MAEAFRQSALGIIVNYRMNNVQTDTTVVGEIASTEDESFATPRM